MTNLDQISQSIGQLQAQNAAMHETMKEGFASLKKVTDEHDERITKNEHGLIKIGLMASVVASVIGFIGTYILYNIFNIIDLIRHPK